ncbi:MAG: glutamine synthetase type III, partial [Clostridia bacterium]|nr:glutamine synthetase type III [Clostridia bacterium]
ILEAFEAGVHHDDVHKIKMSIGTEAIPYIRKDNTDRNRTSPFAFTGNKFEFRMLGSASSISDTNVMINTIVAESFRIFADRLENAKDFKTEATAIIKETVREHKRIIFNGDGYSQSWQEQAAKRGLLNLRSTVDAIPYLRSKENVSLFERHGVLNRVEINCRADITLENYNKILHIEALTLLEMAKRDVIPSILKYVANLCGTVKSKKEIFCDINCEAEESNIKELSEISTRLQKLVNELESTVDKAQKTTGLFETAKLYHEKVLFIMNSVRQAADYAETLVAREFWPYPTYGDLLFKI